MKTVIIFLCFLCSVSYSQNKKHDLIFIEKEIETCRIQINDTLSVYDIGYNIYNNEIKIILKTTNTITKKCIDYCISEDIIKKTKINQNLIIEINNHFIKDLNIVDFKNLIPNKIIALKKRKYSILILELYSFSYSTVGSGYIYECFKLDTHGNVTEKKMLEKTLQIKKNQYPKIF